MKKFIAGCLFTLIIIIILLNVHIIRTDSGFEVTSKDHMTFTDTYVDVRKWTLPDYFSHSPRIRNYLFYEKKYEALSKLVEDAKKGVKGKTEKTLDFTKEKWGEFEKWASEKLK